MKILLIDNYDSFTYNLVHLIKSVKAATVDVVRNDVVEFDKVNSYDKIVLSPGPGIPSEAGRLLEVITTFSSTKSILGVCLGHQAITQAFGGKLINLDTVYHGVSTPCTVVKSNAVLLYGMEKNFEIGRYHSWAADKNTFPAVLDITATDEFGEIMALQHKTLDIHGVQFHPESILTPNGKIIMKNFLNS